ncbi:energy transducer TonB [Thermomonas sp.]|uniref:energy transducer TonB n=1 Tax=Thermomonas sp. TaxID=1971895 RepID=UPI002CAA4E3E|nr:energy transducer TonB [Thermomonas sp.]HRO62456.1 energy transducer TonB [Thermomonas sp.]
MRPLCLLLAVAATLPLRAAEPTQPGVLSYYLDVRVDVDAQGKVLHVEAPADFPEAVRDYVERRVATWQYLPAHENGIAVSATTWVRVGMCALPVAEGYRMGLDFKGNGPGSLNSLTGFWSPPQYPMDAMRRGVGGSYTVHFAIQDDGSAKVTALEAEDKDGKRHLSWFRDGLNRWVSDMRYQPELVNGRPVHTEMKIRVSFRSGDDPLPTPAERQAESEARALTSRECLAAAGPTGLVPVAQNSPVKVTPSPAAPAGAGS